MIMLSSTTFSSSNTTNSRQRKHFSVEKRPRMLKDFLVDDLNSCSSSGFKSFPRRVEDQPMRNLIEMDLHNAENKPYSSNTKRLLRSRLKAAAAATTTISALQAIINTVKSIQFNAVKTPSILPRSLSRRLSKKHNPQNKESTGIETTVRVKDILRWKSFRDLAEEEKSQPSDPASSPDHHCATTTSGSTNTSCSNSNDSSWCDSDFTSEYLPPWNGNFEEYNKDEVKMGKNYFPGVGNNDSLKTTTEAATNNTALEPKELPPCEEKEQRSPVSVIDFQYLEDDDSLSSFNRILDNMESTQTESKQKLMQKIRRFEGLAKVDPFNLEKWKSMQEINEEVSDDDDEETIQEKEDVEQVNEVEEQAQMLLNHVKATNSIGSYGDSVVERLLLDFFVDELSTTTIKRNDENDITEVIRVAKAWLDGVYSAKIDWEAFDRGMDRNSGKWNNKFEEEQEETAWQIENGVLNLLVDELLADLLFC